MQSKRDSENVLDILGITGYDKHFLEQIDEVLLSANNKNQDENNEWNCGICTFLNHPGASNCGICGHPKSTENNAWSCLICTFRNNPYSPKCAMCNAPKPKPKPPLLRKQPTMTEKVMCSFIK